MSANILCFSVFKQYKISFLCLRLHQNNSRQFVRRIHHISSSNAFRRICFIKSKSSILKKFSKEAARSVMELENIENQLSYQQMMCFRKKQAQNSILIEVSNKEDISHAALACEKFGTIKNVFMYNEEKENVFLLLEFSEEQSVKELLSNCQNETRMDAFPISSRILNYRKILQDDSKNAIFLNSNDASTVLKKSKPNQISEMIEDLYFSEKLSELSTRIRFFFCELLRNSLSGLFPHCEVLPFGSSVNGIGKQGCDLDIMIRLYPVPNEKYQFSEFSFLNKTCIGRVQDLQRRSVHGLGAYFRTFLPGLSSVKEVLNARVPILKLEHKLLEIECDISFNQMSAALMSEMIYFCGEVDSRVRPLICAVKKWARDTSITYQYPGSWITNFGLSLLVIFFLQNRPHPILPCFNDAMSIVGWEGSADFKIDYLMPVSDFQAKASVNKESLAVLLKEFLAYVGSNPFQDLHISVLTGSASKTLKCSPLWVQYPLEEDKNVTKNVSQAELDEMCGKARISCKYLSDNLKLTGIQSGDLSTVLGSSFILNKYQHKSIKS